MTTTYFSHGNGFRSVGTYLTDEGIRYDESGAEMIWKELELRRLKFNFYGNSQTGTYDVLWRENLSLFSDLFERSIFENVIYLVRSDVFIAKLLDTSPNSTQNIEPSITSTIQLIDEIFKRNSHEIFEPGMNSEFTNDLQIIFSQTPKIVLRSLPLKLIEYGQYPEILCATLEWLRRQDDASTRKDIRHILVTALKHESRYVRDIAASELAEIDGVLARGPISEAIQAETVPELKKDLADILESLQ